MARALLFAVRLGLIVAVASPGSAAVAGELDDNLASFPASTADERQILAAIGQFKRAWEYRDLAPLKGILARDFELVVGGQTENPASVEPLGEYLKARNDWVKVTKPVGTVSYAVQVIAMSPDRTAAEVSVLSTYRTKYFAPRFIEAFFARREGQHWVISGQTMRPLFARTPEEYGVQVFVAQTRYGAESLSRNFAASILRYGPDFAIDEMRKGELSGAMPEDEVYRSTFFVFRVPPAPEAAISTETFWSQDGNDLKPAVRTVEVRDGQPFLVVETRTASGGDPKKRRTLTWRIRVDDKVVAEKTLPLARASALPDREMDNGAYLPDDLKIRTPAQSVPPAMAKLSGIWQGSWNDDIAAAVAFEEVEPSGAVVVALGLDQDIRHWGAKERLDWFVPHHWIRAEAFAEKDGRVVVFERASDGDALSFQLMPDGSLRGSFMGEDGKKWEGNFVRR